MGDTNKSATKAGRDSKGRFLPGAAPKSPGRPAVAREFRQRCREFMEQEGGGWDILVGMAQGSGSDRRAACELIAAYAYGKPTQGLEVSGKDGGPMGVVILPEVHKDSGGA